MKSKFLLSLVIALICPFVLASCGAPKDPKDMSNTELLNALKKQGDNMLKEIEKCNTAEEIHKVEMSHQDEMEPLMNEIISRDLNQKEKSEFDDYGMELLMKAKEIMDKKGISATDLYNLY